MKPCLKNRKLISWLALGALEETAARELRGHFEICPGCRGYLQEISTVVGSVSAAQAGGDVEASAAFHRRVLGALRKETTASNGLLEWIRWPRWQWRAAWPVFGAVAVALVAVIASLWPTGAPLPTPSVAQVSRAQTAKIDPQPSIANYQVVANRSLDELDELLSRQGTRSLPSSPMQTVAAFTLVSPAD